ncbi:MBL fold metallo-hydrolase [Gemmata sp. JC673]|uniref:MBL fold metallo-hydrolase n=1 Tax=Gemmata algarum TaxID=2975278 RepID=A0ABU5EYN5_9BACT|nr:MBL fold metallo-hydrolase [Gemmata algarum]MDY3560033.1 MBL fold metallo-hydrolase [Gemmata algarum]
MPLTFEVLGGPQRDNALFVKVDTGQSQTRLLFDCGDGCPHQLGPSELREVDHLCFSHLHMDHVAGFDLFFRVNFDRTSKENRIWVPHGSAEVIQNRFRGFMWNLVDEKQLGEWLVTEVAPETVRTTRYLTKEAFRAAHPLSEVARDGRAIFEGDGFTLEAVLLDHGTPSVGYLVREHDRVNVDTAVLAAKGLAPGPWLKRLRGTTAGPGETVEVNGAVHDLAELQREVLVTTRGASIAYLTDFRLTPATADMLVPWLRGVTTVVCESQYRATDADLADAVKHSTSEEVASMAARAEIGRLILFHFSDRYDAAGRRELLRDAQAVFANATFPDGWW